MNKPLTEKVKATVALLRQTWPKLASKHRFVAFSTGKDSLALAAMLYEAVETERPACLYAHHDFEFQTNLDYLALLQERGFAVEVVQPFLAYFELMDRGIGFLTLKDPWCVAALQDASVTVSVRADPLIHGLTDTDAEFDALIAACARVGVQAMAASYLFLRPAIRAALARGIADKSMADRVLEPYLEGVEVPVQGSRSCGRALPASTRQDGFERLRIRCAGPDLALELGEGEQDVQRQTAHGCGGIELLRHRDERYLVLVEEGQSKRTPSRAAFSIALRSSTC